MARTLITATAAIVSLVAIWLIVVMWPPRVAVNGALTDRRLRFRVESNFRINSIMYIGFWKEGADEYLWFVDTNRKLPDAIEYGVPPPDTSQRYPLNGGLARSIESGDVFYFIIHYQYDSAILPAACSGRSTYRFTLSDDGEVRQLELPNGWTYPQNYPSRSHMRSRTRR